MIENKISSHFLAYEGGASHPEVAVVEGIVGVGKTTTISQILKQKGFKDQFTVFHFNMDETINRMSVRNDSAFFYNFVAAKTTSLEKTLIFIDEAQKSAELFEAVKVAWDKGIHFILTGSNPHFMKTKAKSALQRRSRHFDLKPLSLLEILSHQGCLGKDFDLASHQDILLSYVYGESTIADLKAYLATLPLSLSQDILNSVELYLLRGGIPLSYLSKTRAGSYESLRAVVERGFELIEKDSQNIFDDVTYELSLLSGHEFTYKNILRKLRLKKRDAVNTVINYLIGHGYITEKRPFISDQGFGSYHVVYSVIDPGIVSYFWQKDLLSSEEKGALIESYLAARLENILLNGFKKHKVSYYKPYKIRVEMGENKLRFEDGEIDFVLNFGQSAPLACEAKYGENITVNDVPLLAKMARDGTFARPIVFYKGVPRIDKGILFWPYWMI
jgi:predicted AAA+ superfamily ATPase